MTKKNHESILAYAPALEASLDAACLVDLEGKLLFANKAFRSFFSLKVYDLQQEPHFCDLITLDACSAACRISQMLETGEGFRLDETPASRGKEKLRVLLRGTPIGKPPTGAILYLRDTTGEVLLSAKYHKLLSMLDEKDLMIATLKARYDELLETLRRARSAHRS